MTRDLEIQGDIARLLIGKAPHGARLITCSAAMLDGNAACKLQYISKYSSGEEAYFTGGGKFNGEIHDLLNQHSDYFVLQGQPRWTSCALTVDLDREKVSMDLKYD